MQKLKWAQMNPTKLKRAWMSLMNDKSKSNELK